MRRVGLGLAEAAVNVVAFGGHELGGEAGPQVALRASSDRGEGLEIVDEDRRGTLGRRIGMSGLFARAKDERGVGQDELSGLSTAALEGDAEERRSAS